MEKYKMKYISLILLTVFLSSPCFSEEWPIKEKHLIWGSDDRGKGLSLSLKEISEFVTASGKIEIYPFFAQVEDSQVITRTAEMLFGAKGQSSKKMIQFGPNGGGGGGPYQAQLFLWDQGSVSEEQLQQIVGVMESKGKVMPLYSAEEFNFTDTVQYYQNRVLSGDMIEFIKDSIENPTLEDSLVYQQQEQLEMPETLTGVARAFSDYSLLENGGYTEKGLAVIKELGNSSFSFDALTAYGKTDVMKGYGLSGASYRIKDYSSMKGLMLIGPNGGGGAGAYMIQQ